MSVEKAPNEKLTEMLFVSHAMRAFPGQFEVYAPSTVEEARVGYDNQFTGPTFKELVLQFKTPRLPEYGFRVPINDNQHLCLKKYIKGHAYYISHTFRSLKQLQEAARSGSSDPLHFLDNYIAMEIHPMDKYTSSFRYDSDVQGTLEFTCRHRYTRNINEQFGYVASDLIRRFANDDAGVSVVSSTEAGGDVKLICKSLPILDHDSEVAETIRVDDVFAPYMSNEPHNAIMLRQTR